MQPMAARLGVDHQQLQQFLTSSTWDATGVRRRVAQAAVQVVAPGVWVVDDTGFPKDGPASACVARQYSGTIGKVGNCQIAVSVHAATDTASAVLDWRLFVPESWDDTCVPDNAGTVANPHARRLRRQPVALDQAGKKKTPVRKEVPREEQIAQILRRRAASKIPDGERYRPEMADGLGDDRRAGRLEPTAAAADRRRWLRPGRRVPARPHRPRHPLYRGHHLDDHCPARSCRAGRGELCRSRKVPHPEISASGPEYRRPRSQGRC
jgi:hypothetical protein